MTTQARVEIIGEILNAYSILILLDHRTRESAKKENQTSEDKKRLEDERMLAEERKKTLEGFREKVQFNFNYEEAYKETIERLEAVLVDPTRSHPYLKTIESILRCGD
jgi:hypothetical protein